tara:strand:- start:3898 stop:4455 length:558 start_codon:yes stop_codon:yes gene_type:complete
MNESNRLLWGRGGARSSDPRTSKEAAEKFTAERVTAKMRLLAAYDEHGPQSDEQAGMHASVRGAHKRISELIREGYLSQVGEERGPHGTDVRVCALTPDGEELAERLNLDLGKKMEVQEDELERVRDGLSRLAGQLESILDSIHRETRERKMANITLADFAEREKVQLDRASYLLDSCLEFTHDL